MFEIDWIKTILKTEQANCQYNAMPFRLKNVGVTYQRIMNKIFQEEIRETLEVYIEDMIMKSSREELHAQHLHRGVLEGSSV